MESVFESICRLCLASESNLETIFDEKNDLLTKILVVTSIDTTLTMKGFPNSVCNTCKLKLNAAFEFKTQCIKSNDILVQKYEEMLNDNIKKLKIETSEKEKSLFYIRKLKRKRVSEVARDNPTSSNNEIKIEFIPELIEIDIEKLELNPLSEDPVSGKSKIKVIRRRGDRTMCQVCGKMLYDIKQHMTTHTGEKNHTCPHCNKGFSQRGKLKNHINIHTGNKPHKCSLCDKSFADPTSLRSHMITHTGERKYRCELCDKTFGYSHTLSTHKKTHTQDKQHECSFCNRPFLTRQGLKKHIRIHTGEKPYTCEFCNKSFRTSWNLSTHRKIHTKERPHKCPICDMTFAYQSVLTSHMKVHASECNVEVIDESITDRDCLSELGDNV